MRLTIYGFFALTATNRKHMDNDENFIQNYAASFLPQPRPKRRRIKLKYIENAKEYEKRKRELFGEGEE